MADGFIQGGLAFLTYLLVSLVGLRMARRVEPALLVLVTGAAIFVLYAAALTISGRPFNAWSFMTSYWFFVVLFVLCFGAVYKSLSLRILRDLSERPGRSEDYGAVFDRYLIQESFHGRLALIVEKGFATQENGRFELTDKGMVLAQRVRRLQTWFGITHSG